MKNKVLYTLLGVGMLLIAIFVSGALIKGKAQPVKDNKMHNSMFVKAEKVKMTETQNDMTYRGRVTAYDNISLASEVQGKILKGDVRLKDGEDFAKGDLLVNIYSEDVKATLKSGKSSFLQTLSVILPDLKVDYPQEYEKWYAFFNAFDVEKTLPALPEVSSTKEKVFLASNNVLSSYYALQQQEINLSRYKLRAPFAGTFKTVNKEIGAIASPGVELATLIRSDKLEVIVPVFPSELKWVTKGANVQIENNDGISKTATVSRIAGFVEESTQSVNVYLTYNASGKNSFLQGEYVDVNFEGISISGFEIPREALVEDSFVYELKDKKLEKIQVEVLRQLEDSYIISGIDENKVIVTESLASVNSTVEYLARK